MLSRAQQILLKRAQQQAGLTDSEYRDGIATCTGMVDCRSSKDPRLTDEHMDSLLAYFEAIYWCGVDEGQLLEVNHPKYVFRERGFWAARNRRGNTSRDRFSRADVQDQISATEAELAALGYGPAYVSSIRRNIPGQDDWKYLGALQRTLKSKLAMVVQPF